VTAEAIQAQEPMEDTLTGRYLTFMLGEEVYGIEIRYVTEIIGIQPIHRLPEVSEHIKGVINLRGRIIPVIDMRLRFKKEELGYTDRTCIVVVEIGTASAGLIVDQVAEVLEIGDIAPPPDLQLTRKSKAVQGIGKVDGEVKLLLDCQTLLTDEETKFFEENKRGGAEC